MWRSPLEAMPKDDAAYSDQQQGGYLNPSAREQGYTLDEVLASMPSGAVLGIAEKPRWVAEWQAIQAEYPSISSDPLAMHSTYLEAYAALRDYLDTLPTWSDLSTATAITRTTWDGKWADYYAARSALFTRLERKALDDAAAAGDAAATAQGTANGAATAAAAAQTAADEANAAIADIAADGKLTPIEKHQARQEWDVIAAEKVVNDTQATTFGITTEKTAYGTAFQALATYLNAGTTWSSGTPSWLADANLSTTTPIDGPTFRANWKAYYDARTALLNAIAAKAKALADAAQTAANNAQTAANLAGMPPLPNFERDVAGVWPLTRLAASDSDVPEGCPTNFCGRLQFRDGACAKGFPVHPGMRIKLRAWVNTTKTVHGASFGLGFHATADGTDDNSHCSNWGFVPYLAAGSGWTLIEGILTVPAGAVTAYPWPQINAFDNYGSVYFTGLQISEAGAAADDAAYADRLARSSNNLIKNGNSEDANPTGFEAAGVDSTPGRARNGSKCRSISTNSSWTGLVLTPKIQCAEGDEFYFEGWARSTNGTFPYSPRLLIRFARATDIPTQWYVDQKSSLGTSWVKLAISGKAPAETVSVEFMVDCGETVVSGGLIAWDDFYACRKISAGMLEGDILKALLIKGEVIETPNYVPGSAGVPPVGVKISGVPFAATLKDGSTLQVNMELGTSASLGGERVQTILDALFANQAEFQAGQSGTWTAPKSGWLEVLMCGGGGSGAHSSDGSHPVCGGGGGGVLKYTIWVTKGQQIAYSVGSGGPGVTNDWGSTGGDTTFGAATAKGGTRGGVASTSGGPGGAVIPPTSLGGQIAGAAAGVSTSITTGFDVLAACPGAGGGNATTYGGGTTWFAPWTSGDQGTGGSSGLGRGGQSGTAPTGYGAGSGAGKNTSSASLPGGPGYLRLRW